MTAIGDPLKLSAELATSERRYMARWLALEVLMTDDFVIADTELWERLSALQERWQADTLARYGVAP